MHPALLAILIVVIVLAAAVWWWQVRTPRRIRWRDGSLELLGRVQVADGLVLQHDDGEAVWATRGYAIYRSVAGGDFRLVGRMRPPAGEAWGGYLRVLRRMFGYQELVELIPVGDDRLVVFCGGWVHVVELAGAGVGAGAGAAGARERVRIRSARRVLKLRYFGRGKGRGLMAFGLTLDLHGALYFAEYVTESGERPTGIWKSEDRGETWRIVYEFPAGMVRHVHVVQCDPFDGALWIGTGDRDEHCFVGRSTDGGESFTWVGTGRQIHRTCSFAFFADAVVWPMDADFEQNHLIRWPRAGGELSVDGELPDATYCTAQVDEQRALLGVAQGVAEVWIGFADGRTAKWCGWEIDPTPPARGPSPGVRLARGSNVTGSHLHVNPLRTIPHEAAIIRIDRALLPS